MKYFAVLFLLSVLLVKPVPAQDTVQVYAGWNIIGSVKAGTIPDVLSADPPGIITTAFFGYDPGAGYASTDSLRKGLGYWVKVSSDGLIVFNTSSAGECGIKTVEYEGRIYRTVRIGSQCWLDRNLNVGTMVSGGTTQTDDDIIERYCYNNDTISCIKYGGLYQWDEAMQYSTTEGAQGICPPGWHLPTYAEYETLKSAMANDGHALMAQGEGAGLVRGTDESGFSALLAGFRFTGGIFSNQGINGFFWSSTLFDPSNPYYLYLFWTSDGIYIYGNNPKDLGYNVRCLED